MSKIQKRWVFAALSLMGVIGVFAPTLHSNFYYDDPLQLADALIVIDDPALAFGPGSFGRFRPLRLLTLACIATVFGVVNPFPFHAWMLILHLGNVVLFGTLLHRMTRLTDLPLDERQGFLCVWGATAIFAVNAAGSEAVTYLSAIGMLYVTMGGLIVGHALMPVETNAGAWRWFRKSMYGIGGMTIAVLGGEYWIALIPMMVGFAAWPRKNGVIRWRNAALVALGLVLVLAVYGWFQHQSVKPEVAAQVDFSLARWITQHAAIVSRMFWPGGLLDESYGVWVVLALVGMSGLISECRRYLFSRSALLLLWIGWSTAMPFAFNALVNGGRFTYPGVGFVVAWAIGLLVTATCRIDRLWARGPCGARLATGALAVMLILNVMYLYKRVQRVAPRGDSIVALAQLVRSVGDDNPHRTTEVYFINSDVEHARVYLDLLKITPAERIFQGIPAYSNASKDFIKILVQHDRRTGYMVTEIQQ